MKHFALFYAVTLALAISASAQEYKSVGIPSPNGSPRVVAMNRVGQVVGRNTLPAAAGVFLWSKSSGTQYLGTLGGTSAVVSALNDSGQVAGYSDIPGDSVQHAFRWTASSGMQDLGTLGGFSAADAMNAAGTVVGGSVSSSSNMERAFLWTPTGGMRDIGFGDGSYALAINDPGEVLGVSCALSCNTFHSYLWSSSRGVESLDVPGSTSTHVLAINNREQVIGSYTSATGTFAFFWTRSAGFQTLPLLNGSATTASFLNGAGQVAGSSCTAPGRCHAFIWSSAGGIQDLGAPPNQDQIVPLAVNGSGEVLGVTVAHYTHNLLYFLWNPQTGLKQFPNYTPSYGPGALNDAGQIAGQTGSGGYRAFLLSPLMHVTVTSSLNPSKKGQSVTFTANVTSVQGAPPDGELVTFKAGGKSLGTVPLVGGSASLAATFTTVGTHPIVARYAGDVNYDANSSAPLQQVVAP